MNSASQVILHIGPHKTGTTYIQQYLLRSRARLAEIGLVYPEEFCEKPGHHALSREMMGAPETANLALAKLAELTARILKNGQSAIFSSENLSLLSEAQMTSLRAGLAPLPTRAVIYLRDRGPVIWSQWQEHVKFGEVRSLPDYVAGLMLRTPEVNAIDPLGLAVRTLRAVGAVDLVDYDGCVADGRDLTDPILRLAAGRPVELPKIEIKHANTRLPQERVEILRLLNLMQLRRGKKPGKTVRRLYLTALREQPEVVAAEAEATKLITPHLTDLPMAMIDRYFRGIDAAHARKLADAGVSVPPFGAARPKADVAGFAYLPDAAILFSRIPGAVRDIFRLIGLDKGSIGKRI